MPYVATRSLSTTTVATRRSAAPVATWISDAVAGSYAQQQLQGSSNCSTDLRPSSSGDMILKQSSSCNVAAVAGAKT